MDDGHSKRIHLHRFTILCLAAFAIISCKGKDKLSTYARKEYTSSNNVIKKEKLPLINTNQVGNIKQQVNIDPDASQCRGALKKIKRPSVDLIDKKNKLKIMASPKAGATLAAQLMFRKLGILETALSHNPWIHRYRIEIFMKDSKFEHSSHVCYETDWVCIKLVRSVFDRIISSYIYIMKDSRFARWFKALRYVMDTKGIKGVADASFSDFVSALVLQNEKEWRSTGDAHYLPQSEEENDYRDDVYLVPIESIEEGLDALGVKTGMSLNATGLTSSHYVDKSLSPSRNITDAAHMSWSMLRKDKIPSYASFFQNNKINKHICELYCSDFALYAAACKSSWLQSCPNTQRICAREREKTISICGKEYDFF